MASGGKTGPASYAATRASAPSLQRPTAREDRPFASDLRCRLLLHLPSAGRRCGQLETPRNAPKLRPNQLWAAWRYDVSKFPHSVCFGKIFGPIDVLHPGRQTRPVPDPVTGHFPPPVLPPCGTGGREESRFVATPLWQA